MLNTWKLQTELCKRSIRIQFLLRNESSIWSFWETLCTLVSSNERQRRLKVGRYVSGRVTRRQLSLPATSQELLGLSAKPSIRRFLHLAVTCKWTFSDSPSQSSNERLSEGVTHGLGLLKVLLPALSGKVRTSSDNLSRDFVSNSDPSVVQPVASRYIDCATAAGFHNKTYKTKQTP
jgi:hypothetical protein